MNLEKRLKRLQKTLRLVDEAVARARAEAEAAGVLRKQGPGPDPYMGYLAKAAAGGSAAAREELMRARPEPDSEVRAYAAGVLKSSSSGEARQLAQAVLDELDRDAEARFAREGQLRKEGWRR